MEVELVVAGADDDLAALLGEVGDARIKLDVAIIFQSLTQMDELKKKQKWVFVSIPGDKMYEFSAGFL